MNEAELAYLAGFFDGEGHIQLRHTDISYSASICVSNTDYAVLEDYVRLFGGSIGVSRDTGKTKKLWRWQLFGKNSADALRKLSPYLRQKKTQAQVLLNFYATIGKSGKLVTEETRGIRDNLIAELLQLRSA